MYIQKTGAIIDTELDWQAIGLFSQAKGDIDRARERYENMVEAGKKGGCATKYDTEKAEQMVLEGATTDEIMEEIGCSKRCAQYYKAEFSSKNTENESNNDASAISAISAIRCNNLEKEKEKEKDTEREKERENERENEREREKEKLFPPTFAHEIYSLYQELGLPLPKTGEIGFLQYDMKKGFENIKRQHLLLEDVIEAVKNYAKALSARDTWYHARLSFDRFTRQDSTIQNYKKNTSVLPFWGEDFDIEKSLKMRHYGRQKNHFFKKLRK